MEKSLLPLIYAESTGWDEYYRGRRDNVHALRSQVLADGHLERPPRVVIRNYHVISGSELGVHNSPILIIFFNETGLQFHFFHPRNEETSSVACLCCLPLANSGLVGVDNKTPFEGGFREAACDLPEGGTRS